MKKKVKPKVDKYHVKYQLSKLYFQICLQMLPLGVFNKLCGCSDLCYFGNAVLLPEGKNSLLNNTPSYYYVSW